MPLVNADDNNNWGCADNGHNPQRRLDLGASAAENLAGQQPTVFLNDDSCGWFSEVLLLKMARMSLGSLLLFLPLLTCSNPVNNTSSSTSPTISSTPSTFLATTASDATEKFSNMSASSSTAKPTITMMSNIEISTSTSIPTSSSNGTSTTSFSSESNDNSSSPTSLPPTSTTSSAAPPISSSMASNSTIKQRDVGSNMSSIHQLAGSISADSDGAQRRDISSGEQVSGNSDGSSAGEGEQPDGGRAGELPLMPARLSIGVQQRQPQGNDSQEEASNSTGLLSSTTAATAPTTRSNSNHGTTNSTTNRPGIRSKRDYISDAVERMKEAASNTQQQLQQAGNLASLPNNSNQLQTQVIPIPPIDLSGQQTQNIVLVSDNGNVTLRRGQNFLSVETVMLQQKN